jgi:hypothetical protein
MFYESIYLLPDIFGGQSGLEKAGLFTDIFHRPIFTGCYSGAQTDIEELENMKIIL